MRRNSEQPYVAGLDLEKVSEGVAGDEEEENLNEEYNDEDEDEDEAVSSSDLPPPPDGGWGWVVVFASFMIHIVGKTSMSL